MYLDIKDKIPAKELISFLYTWMSAFKYPFNDSILQAHSRARVATFRYCFHGCRNWNLPCPGSHAAKLAWRHQNYHQNYHPFYYWFPQINKFYIKLDSSTNWKLHWNSTNQQKQEQPKSKSSVLCNHTLSILGNFNCNPNPTNPISHIIKKSHFSAISKIETYKGWQSMKLKFYSGSDWSIENYTHYHTRQIENCTVSQEINTNNNNRNQNMGSLQSHPLPYSAISIVTQIPQTPFHQKLTFLGNFKNWDAEGVPGFSCCELQREARCRAAEGLRDWERREATVFCKQRVRDWERGERRRETRGWCAWFEEKMWGRGCWVTERVSRAEMRDREGGERREGA